MNASSKLKTTNLLCIHVGYDGIHTWDTRGTYMEMMGHIIDMMGHIMDTRSVNIKIVNCCSYLIVFIEMCIHN